MDEGLDELARRAREDPSGEAREAYRRALERELAARPDDLALRLLRGVERYEAARYDEAEDDLERAKQDPRSRARACYYLGLLSVRRKDLERALVELELVREECFPSEASFKDATYLIGRIYEGAGRKAKAMAY